MRWNIAWQAGRRGPHTLWRKPPRRRSSRILDASYAQFADRDGHSAREARERFPGAECFAVTVQPTGDLSGLSARIMKRWSAIWNFSAQPAHETEFWRRRCGFGTHQFARRNRVTQISSRVGPKRLVVPHSPVNRRKVYRSGQRHVGCVVSDREPSGNSDNYGKGFRLEYLEVGP